MSKPDIGSVSAALLGLMNQLFPFTHNEPETSSATQRTPLDEHREHLFHLSKQLEHYSWAIAIFLHSLAELKRTRNQLELEHAQVLAKAEQLVAANPKTIHLPNEILGFIAQYAHPNALSIEEAVYLTSSGRKWDEIVLKSSLVRLDDKSFESPSLQGILFASSPAKLVIKLGWSAPKTAVRTLLPFRGRWHSLCTEDTDDLREELLAEYCLNCPPCHDGFRKCEKHAVLSSLGTLITKYHNLPSFAGFLQRLKHLNLTITSIEESPIGFLELATEVPLLTELIIFWDSWSDSSPSIGDKTPTILPNLRRVIFIQENPTVSLRNLEFAFSYLDGSTVEHLDVRIVNELNDCEEDRHIMFFLGETFPSIKSLTVRKTLKGNWSYEEMNGVMRQDLETLIPDDDGEALFPQLMHLSLELDDTPEGLHTLSQIILGRYDHRQPSGSFQEIMGLELFTPTFRRAESTDLLDVIQGYVQHLTICVQPWSTI